MENYIAFFAHHWQLSTLLAVLVIAIIVYELFFAAGKAKGIDPQKSVFLINHENAVVLDVRADSAFNSGHIINAVNIPLVKLISELKKLDRYKNKPIIVVDAFGQQSARAAEILRKNEFINVSVLRGGIKAWQEAKLPLERRR